MKTPVLETERILLRPLSIKDADEIYNNWTSDPDVAKYMRWDQHHTVDETKEWLAMEEDNIEKETSYCFAFVLKQDHTLFGSGGLIYHPETAMFELGYNIMKKYWNMGLTTEASKRIIEFAVSELGETRFFALHAVENVASGMVIRKLGFQYQRDGTYTSFSGNRTFNSKEYLLEVKE